MRGGWRGRGLVFCGVAAAAVVLAASIIGVAGDPFGDSHDGRNGAVWGRASHALRVDGPVESRLGARFVGGAYANHPPLIVLETAAAETLAGARRWVTRAPAWIGSLAAAVLLWRLLRRLGTGPPEAALGIAIAVASPLFAVYASMLDTPVTSLPFGVALLGSWVRPPGDGGRSAALGLGALALVAGLAGWQAMFLGGILVGASLLQGRRRDAAALLAGVASALALVLAHQLWVHGSLDALLEQFRNRTTTRLGERFDVSWADAMVQQATWFVSLVSPVALVAGSVGLVLLWRDRGERRAAAGVAAATVVGYDLLLVGGAAFHDYWSYWSVVPLCLGAARSVAWLVDAWSDLARPVRVGLAAIVAVAPLAAATPTGARRDQADGVAAAHLVRRAPRPVLRGYLVQQPEAWARYERGELDARPGPECGNEPGCLVLVVPRDLAEEGVSIRSSQVVDSEGIFALVRLGDLRSTVEAG